MDTTLNYFVNKISSKNIKDVAFKHVENGLNLFIAIKYGWTFKLNFFKIEEYGFKKIVGYRYFDKWGYTEIEVKEVYKSWKM